jgi:hypothetical protein
LLLLGLLEQQRLLQLLALLLVGLQAWMMSG